MTVQAGMCLTWSENLKTVFSHRGSNKRGGCSLASWLVRVLDSGSRGWGSILTGTGFEQDTFETRHEKNGFLPRQKQRCRSALQ